MPDINPADLSSRPAVNLTTPTLSNKTITVSTPSTAAKPIKTSQIIPARIDLEPIYAALKSAIGNEPWATYKEATTQFFIGQLSHTSPSVAHPAYSNPMLTLPPSHRPTQPGRVLRAHRPYNIIPTWRQGTPAQPAPGCPICQCHP